MAFSLNPLDYDSINDFVIALDSSISHLANRLAKCMSLGIEHHDLFEELFDQYLLRMTYEYDHEASSLVSGGTTRITIPLTADMTFIFSDAVSI